MLSQHQALGGLAVRRIGEREDVVLDESELLGGMNVSRIRDCQYVVLHQAKTIGRVCVSGVLDDKLDRRAVRGEDDVVASMPVSGIGYDKDVVLDKRGLLGRVGVASVGNGQDVVL